MRLYNLLVQTGCESELLIPLVENIFLERPELTLREMMPVILEWYDKGLQLAVQKPKTPKSTLVQRTNWASLESDDLRFVYSQLDKKEDIYRALKDNRFILDLKMVS